MWRRMGAWWPPRSSTPTWSSNSTRRVRFPSASAMLPTGGQLARRCETGKGTVEMSRVYVSLIQSDYGLKSHGNFEAVITQDEQLWHWFRDNSRNDFGPWARGQRITGDQDTVAAPGCLIQSDYRSGSHGNFEVIVPLQLPNGSTELRHFWRDNNNPQLPWNRGARITGDHDNVAAAACPIQPAYRPGTHANFAVI